MTAPPPLQIRIFIPGTLVNPLNGAHGHWSKSARYRKTWRQKVMLNWRAIFRDPHAPKCVSITAYTWNVLDSHDGLRAALKPCIDGLIDAGVIHSDADSAGHLFIYAQEIRRKNRGVAITVEVT